MSDKYHSDTKEKIETISYSPNRQNTGDLEAGTKTITATSMPGTADYSKALTIASPSDARLVVKRIAARLRVTRDSGASTNLYCTVTVDSADGSANKLFDAVDVQAANLQAVDTHSGNLATIFDLLKDGASHTFYFFFWVDAGDSVISLVQLWEGVGSFSTAGYSKVCMTLNHKGLVSGAVNLGREGSGTPNGIWGMGNPAFLGDARYRLGSGDSEMPLFLAFNDTLQIGGSVATDLNYLRRISLTLRSEQ